VCLPGLDFVWKDTQETVGIAGLLGGEVGGHRSRVRTCHSLYSLLLFEFCTTCKPKQEAAPCDKDYTKGVTT
jgi:hypothetical protein